MMMMLLPMIAMGKITLTENNHVLFKGVVNAETVGKASRDLLKISFKTKPGDTIYLVLDSPGGSIDAGLDFVQLLTSIPRNVECIALKAHSMAHHFLQACPGKRYGTMNVKSMAHRASGSFRGTFNDGAVEQQLKLWTGIVQSMEKVNAKRMELSLEKYHSLVKDEYWCHGYGCVKKNFLDEIAKVTCNEKLVNTKSSRTVNTFFGSFRVVSTACPLIKYTKVEPIRRR